MQPEALTTTRRRVGTSPGATAGGGRQRGSSAGDGMSPRQLATVALVFSYTAWFVLIATGVAAYEGEPVLVKSADLPLHYFDLLFRRLGALLLFALWAVRAAASYAAPAALLRKRNTVVAALLAYLLQAALRMGIYQLHLVGYIFTAKRYARDNLDHPPHVMSDHILLGAALMGGFACEAALSLLSLGHARGAAARFCKWYAVAATALAVLVSSECYFTSRYFHAPHEILFATALGLALFQAPLLAYTAHEMHQHEQRPAAVAG